MTARRYLWLPNGSVFFIVCRPLHRRHSRGGVYRRPTDWLACAGRNVAWGRTRRDAVASLVDLMGAGARVGDRQMFS